MGNIEKTGFPVLHSLLVQKECDNTGEILFIYFFILFFFGNICILHKPLQIIKVNHGCHYHNTYLTIPF